MSLSKLGTWQENEVIKYVVQPFKIKRISYFTLYNLNSINYIKRTCLKVIQVFNQTFYSQFEGSLDDISVRTASGSCYKDRYHKSTQQGPLA